MRRSAPRLLARAAECVASTSGVNAGAVAAYHTLSAPRLLAAWPGFAFHQGRGFSALPAGSGGREAGSGGGRETTTRGGASTSTSTSTSVSGHPREVTARDIGVPAAVQTARDVLHHAALVHFRESLEHESETRLSMPTAEALELAKACHVADTDEEARAALAAAHNAGLVLRFQGTVFLRPAEVADLVLRALPDTDLEVRSRLATLEAQLAPLDAQKQLIDAAARTRSRRVLWFGVSFLTAQLATYAYLTWGHPHWGWDATEPFTYFTGQGIAVSGLIFYMVTKKSAEPGEIERHVAAGAVKAGAKAHGFDAAAHARLASDVARYRRYLERQQSH